MKLLLLPSMKPPPFNVASPPPYNEASPPPYNEASSPPFNVASPLLLLLPSM
jgi:hypothetical protein